MLKVILVCIVVLVAFFLYPKNTSGNTKLFPQAKTIDEITWQHARHIQVKKDLKNCIQQGKPVIVRRTKHAIVNWPHWTPEYLSKHAKPFRFVYAHKHATFFYFDKENVLPLTNAQQQGRALVLEHEMNVTSFFRDHFTNKRPGDMYLYYSQQVKTLGEFLNSEIDPTDLMVNDWDQSVNVWIGGMGSTAQCHYDVSQNCFYQMYGTKDFYLFAPEQWEDLYLFSRLHPYHRQSQMNINALDTKVFPRSAKLVPYFVRLNEGDMLYLPPFWFHHVVAPANNISISVNVWSGCNEYNTTMDMLAHPIPFEENWNKETNIAALVEYLTYIVKALQEKSKRANPNYIVRSPKEYMQYHILDTKYKFLLAEKTLPARIPQSWCSKPMLEKYRNKFKDYANQFADLAMTIDGSIRDMLVTHVFEKVIAFFVADDELVGAFLNTCFK